MLNSNPKISIVIPVFNEAENLPPLLKSINSACSSLSMEIIIIDDGSTDETLKVSKKLCSEYSVLRIIPLRKNFGQTAAMAAGIDHAKGEIIIPLDGDGQNDPVDILKLIEKIEMGFDVVSGWRKNRQDGLFLRKIPSWMANALISFVTGVHLHDYGCTLKAYRAPLIKDIQIAGEMHRFLPAWCAWRGGKITEIPVRHHPRTKGVSKYGLFRIFKVIIDLMTIKFFSGYLSKPNYLFSGSGMIFFTISLMALAFALVDKFYLNQFPDYRIPLLLLSTFFGLISVFLVLLGLLAELLVRLYFSVQNQKPYTIADETTS